MPGVDRVLLAGTKIELPDGAVAGNEHCALPRAAHQEQALAREDVLAPPQVVSTSTSGVAARNEPVWISNG